jgi:YbbR domain-containing protein
VSPSVRNVSRSIRSNWSLKLAAVLLALLSFYAVRGATSFEVDYEIPLEIRAGKGIAILDQDTRTVQLTFRGSREDLRRLDPSQLRVVIRPKEIETGVGDSEQLPVTPRDLEGAPGGVRVISVRPALVKATFDLRTEKKVAVIKPKTTGTPLTGKVEIDYEPRFVTIRGPTKRLRDKVTVQTEAVNVEGRVASFTTRVRVLPDGDSWVSEIDPPEVTVKVNIVESVTRKLTGVPVLAAVRPGRLAGLSIEPKTVTISLSGRADVLDKFTEASVKVFVDCAQLDSPAAYQLPLTVHLPPGTDVGASVEPSVVRVEVLH